MKVENFKKPNTVEVKQLSDGQCFEYEVELFLLVYADYYVSEDDVAHHVFCANLNSGELVRLGKDTEVVSMTDRVKVVVE